ncbi:MAG: hypothetical protein IIY78_05265 [Clostridia bacterium]|nr:hypothetical protein [Clostridia bacterium]
MIDANSKANRFLEAIEKYAEQQRTEMREEIEAFRKEQLEEANNEGTNAAFVFIQEQKAEFKAALAKETALKETQKKRELFAKRSKMANEVFDEAASRLKKFTKTEKYKEYMATSARLISGKLDGKSCVISIAPKDSGFEQLIKSIMPNCVVKPDESILIGGISCLCEELSIVIDDTLDTKLEDRKQRFIETSGLMVE